MNRYCYLFVIDKCNLACPTCANKYFMPKYTGNFDINLLKKLDIAEYDRFFITGGEPGLLNIKDKKILIDYLEFTYPNTELEVFTNGTNIHHWPKRITKLIHIVNLKESIVHIENSSYVIVVNSMTDKTDIINLVNKYKSLKFNIKNDCYAPISSSEFSNLMKNIDNCREKSIKSEEETHKCYKVPNKKSAFNAKMSLTKKCTCFWFNCLNDENNNNS